MFFINSRSLPRKRETVLLQILPTAVVFAAFVVVTLFSWSTTQSNLEREHYSSLVQANQAVANRIEDRLLVYEDALRSSAALFSVKPDMTRADWKRYVANLNIDTRYPGMLGMGYAPIIQQDELPEYILSAREKTGDSTYAVFPKGKRTNYVSVLFLEPATQKNERVLGYDMLTDKVRKLAMEHARDTGEATLSGLTNLLQDRGNENAKPAFLLYVPVYTGSTIPDTVAERRQQLTGYIYTPFRAEDFIKQVISSQAESYGFKINTLVPTDKVVYQSTNYASIQSNETTLSHEVELNHNDTIWRIGGTADVNIVGTGLRSRPTSVLVVGLCISAIVASFIYLLLKNRARVLSRKEELNIQQAKDELLALASHQLRTPATGVKQYIGMLREGFAGTLNETQANLVEKAYQSNERQLGTINEMLFVARSDAGQLKMEMREFDLGQLVSDILEEQKNVANKVKKHDIKLHLPDMPTIVMGDKLYIRMAVENIISNASKYTKNHGKINVSIRTGDRDVIVSVTDNGVGVSHKDQRFLFKKFSRIPNELSNIVSGSGMGLYLAKTVIMAHQGTIDFHSEEGVGSTVTICLPRADQSDN